MFSNGLVSFTLSLLFLSLKLPVQVALTELETPTVSAANRQPDAQGEKKETMNGWMLSF